jgi:hypothetical protein
MGEASASEAWIIKATSIFPRERGVGRKSIRDQFLF